MIIMARIAKAIMLSMLILPAALSAQDNDDQGDRPHFTSTKRLCSHDPSFDAFLKSLKSVVRRRNPTDLLALTTDDVQNRFPFEPGKSEMILMWYLRDNPKKSFVWPTVRTLLKRPCTQDKTGRRWMDDGIADGYFMFIEKRGDQWLIAGISGDPG
jgi:hypothetical protein